MLFPSKHLIAIIALPVQTGNTCCFVGAMGARRVFAVAYLNAGNLNRNKRLLARYAGNAVYAFGVMYLAVAVTPCVVLARLAVVLFALALW